MFLEFRAHFQRLFAVGCGFTVYKFGMQELLYREGSGFLGLCSSRDPGSDRQFAYNIV